MSVAGSRLELDSLTKSYGAVSALRGVSLSVAEGELVAVVGPSGCGKSTLLSLVAGLDAPTSGVIRIDGRAVNELSPRERDVAMVFQSYALYPHMTVRKNLAFPLDVAGLPRAGDRGRAWRRSPRCSASRRSSTAARRRSPAASASAWRSAARSCAARKVFLLDEPLSNLDAALRLGGARRAEEAARAARRDVRLRDARPGGGDDARGPHRGAAGRRARAGGHAEGDLRRRPPPPSWRASSGPRPMNLVAPEVLGRCRPGARTWRSGRRICASSLGEAGPGLEARVWLVEPMGSETWVTVERVGARLVARCGAGFDAPPGAPVRLAFDSQRACWFDRETGRRSPPPRSP